MFDVIIFDLDGTLTNLDHRIHLIPGDGKDDSANWDKFSLASEHDSPYEDICKLSRYLFDASIDLLIFSGRGEIARDVSEQWLRDNNIKYDWLWMRSIGDYRDDRELKREWFDELHFKHRDVMIFEDRDKVVKMWRDMGIRCLQVKGGAF